MYNMKEKKLKYLKYYDIIFITLVMFGSAIYSSTLGYYELINGAVNISENLYFSELDNWFSTFDELVRLVIVFIYLYIRGFNFSKWKFKINWKVVLSGIGIYIISSLIMDLSSFAFGFSLFPLEYTGEHIMIKELLEDISLSLIRFSILNGFFEEIFFLGICMNVEENNRIKALIYSMIIRTSFHTYQGIASALAIGIGIGLLFYFVYKKDKNKNLAPVMVAHTMSDILGAGIIGFLIY